MDDTEKVTVRVVVPSDYTSKDIDVSAAGVKLNNVPAGYTAKVTALNSDSVTIIGPKSAIRGLKAKNVVLSCDLTAKKGESIKTGTPPTAGDRQHCKGGWHLGLRHLPGHRGAEQKVKPNTKYKKERQP